MHFGRVWLEVETIPFKADKGHATVNIGAVVTHSVYPSNEVDTETGHDKAQKACV